MRDSDKVVVGCFVMLESSINTESLVKKHCLPKTVSLKIAYGSTLSRGVSSMLSSSKSSSSAKFCWLNF